MKRETWGNCPDCNVGVGEAHLGNCDVARCPECGDQMLTCAKHQDCWKPVIWTGDWPGYKECFEFGWASKLTDRGWERTTPDDPESTPDLSRLGTDPSVRWDNETQMFVRK